MNKDEVIKGIYEYLTLNLPKDALSIIVENDIRVENFFAIHTGVCTEIGNKILFL
jgi:hypothetical protein